jgi:hypothetical protein
MARRATQTLELQSGAAYLDNRIGLEQHALLRSDGHTIQPRAVRAALVIDIELSLLKADGEMWIRHKVIVQSQVTELWIASHLDDR